MFFARIKTFRQHNIRIFSFESYWALPPSQSIRNPNATWWWMIIVLFKKNVPDMWYLIFLAQSKTFRLWFWGFPIYLGLPFYIGFQIYLGDDNDDCAVQEEFQMFDFLGRLWFWDFPILKIEWWLFCYLP